MPPLIFQSRLYKRRHDLIEQWADPRGPGLISELPKRHFRRTAIHDSL